MSSPENATPIGDRLVHEHSSKDLQDVDTKQVAKGKDYPTGFRLFVIVAALFTSMFLLALDLTILATAIPKITDEFHRLDHISWYASAFFLTLGGFQSSWGRIYKFFPLKTSFICSILLFELGSLISAVAPSSAALIVGRAISGVGAAGQSSGSYYIMSLGVEPSKRPVYTSILGAAYGIACVLGPIIAPIGGAAAAIIFLFFQPRTSSRGKRSRQLSLREKLTKMDPVGVLLVMALVVCYILALQYGGLERPWRDPVVIGLLIGFAVISISFVAWEVYMSDNAMVPLRLVKQRVYLVSCIYWFLFGGGWYIVLYYIPIYFQSIDGVSAIQSGVRNLPVIIAVIFSTIFSGSLVTKTGWAQPVMVVGSIIAIIGTCLLYRLDIGTTTGQWIGYQIVAGVGYGSAFQMPMVIGQAVAPVKDLPQVTAIILCGVLKAYMRGLKMAFAVGIVAVGLALLVSVCGVWKRIPTGPPQDEDSDEEEA
ncbi:hypothetical protein DV737_g1486, partial [Chaetothyriales sp. CBS 132003]